MRTDRGIARTGGRGSASARAAKSPTRRRAATDQHPAPGRRARLARRRRERRREPARQRRRTTTRDECRPPRRPLHRPADAHRRITRRDRARERRRCRVRSRSGRPRAASRKQRRTRASTTVVGPSGRSRSSTVDTVRGELAVADRAAPHRAAVGAVGRRRPHTLATTTEHVGRVQRGRRRQSRRRSDATAPSLPTTSTSTAPRPGNVGDGGAPSTASKPRKPASCEHGQEVVVALRRRGAGRASRSASCCQPVGAQRRLALGRSTPSASCSAFDRVVVARAPTCLRARACRSRWRRPAVRAVTTTLDPVAVDAPHRDHADVVAERAGRSPRRAARVDDHASAGSLRSPQHASFSALMSIGPRLDAVEPVVRARRRRRGR